MVYRTRETTPEVPSDQKISDALLKQARKLRWMGLEDEANRTQKTLRQSELAGSILTAPRETD